MSRQSEVDDRLTGGPPTDRPGLCYQHRKLVSRGTKAIVTHVESSVGKIKPDRRCLQGVPLTPAAFHPSEQALRNAVENMVAVLPTSATEEFGHKTYHLSLEMM